MNQPVRHCNGAWLPTESGLFSSSRRRLLLSFVVAVVGVTLSLLFSWLAMKQELELAKIQFLRSAENRAKAVQIAVTDRLSTVGTLAAYFAGSEMVDRKEFRTFVKPLLDEHAGILALGWAPRIEAAQRQAHERFVRDNGFSKYKITEQDDRGRFVPAGIRAEYWPILYIEPFEKNQSQLGVDVQSTLACRAAIQLAMSAKRPAAGTCMPIDEDAAGHVLLHVVALARNEVSGQTAHAADQPADEGFVFAALRIDTLLESVLDPMSAAGIDVSVIAPSGTGGDTLVYPRPSVPRDQEAMEAAQESTDGSRFVAEIDVADSRWKFNCVALKSYWARRRTWEPPIVLLGGLLVTGLLVGYLHLLTGRTARVEQLVAKRTHELNDERWLLRTMLDMHERDRKLVAYEIHDGLAQQLAGTLYKFQSIDHLRDRDPDAAREMFDEAIRLLHDAMAETRRLIGGLRPPILDESGVVDAVSYLISEQHQRGGPEIEFVHPEEFGRLAPPLESAIFRIVQECLTNACRYSQSEKVRVELGQAGDRVHVEVRDWGIGFDPAHVERDHFGIQGIRERAKVLGGSAVIEAALGQGTRISVDLPLLSAIENGTAKTAE